MGCSLCKEERQPETKNSMAIAKNYFTKKNKNLDRINNKKNYKLLTSQKYKQKLIDLLQQKRAQNEQIRQREQETYLNPFQKIVDSHNTAKYEELVLSIQNVRRKAEAILKKKKSRRRVEEEDEMSIENKELNDMLQKMAMIEYLQGMNRNKKKYDSTFFQSQQNNMGISQIGTNQRQSIVPQENIPNFTGIGPLVYSENVPNFSHQISQESSNSFNQQPTLDKSQSASNNYQRPRNSNQLSTNTSQLNYQPNLERAQSALPYLTSMSRTDSSQYQNYQSNQLYQLSDQRYYMHSMVDNNQDYQTPKIQIQKVLFNYLYRKVSCNEHIVKYLVDEFGDLIWEKFYPNFEYMAESLTNSQVDNLKQIVPCIETDIKFLITFLKEYLQAIYGETVLPENQFTSEQLDKIFDLFVRKIVFDNQKISNIAKLSISRESTVEQEKIKQFLKRVKQKLNIQNAFIRNEKLRFLSDCPTYPFSEIDEQLKIVQTTPSPFFKLIQVRNIRKRTLEILDKLSKESQEEVKELNQSEFLLVYYFILTQTDVDIFIDLKFIYSYTKSTSEGNDFADIYYGIFEDMLEYSSKDAQCFIDYFFYDINEKQQQIDEVDESFSISQASRLSNHQIGHEFLFQPEILQQKTQKNHFQTMQTGAINQQSASSHTITECLGENNTNSNNYQLVFSNSDILSTNHKKDRWNDNEQKLKENYLDKSNQQFSGETSIDRKEQTNRSFFGEESQQMISTAAAAHSSMHMEEQNDLIQFD